MNGRNYMTDDEARSLLLLYTARGAYQRPRAETVRMVKGYAHPALTCDAAMSRFWDLARSYHALERLPARDSEAREIAMHRLVMAQAFLINGGKELTT